MNQEIDPWGDFPQVGKEVPTTLEGYKSEVLAGKTYITAEMFEAAGYKVPYVDEGSFIRDQMKAAELFDQGLPCFLKVGGEWEYSLQPYSVTEQAIQDISMEALEAAMEEERWAKYPNRLKSVSDMLQTPEIDWLVEDKVHRTGLFQLFGESYAGKTLLTLDLVLSWCAGLPKWQGYRLNNGGEPQEALYVAAEGGAAVSVHVDAWLKYNGIERSRLDGLYFLDGGDGDHVFLSVKKSRKDEEAIPYEDSFARLFEEVQAVGINPSLVVFDTQIDLAPSVEENSNTEMVGILRDVKRMADKAGFLAMVIHHTGHDGNKARGASGMKGKCDVQAKLTVIGEKTGKAKLEWTKVKGREIPKDSISYHIQGSRLLPDLDSEGAVCVPLKAQELFEEMVNTEGGLGSNIMKTLQQNGPMSARELSEKLEVGRNSKDFKDMLEGLLNNNEIQQTGNGSASKYSIHPLAHR